MKVVGGGDLVWFEGQHWMSAPLNANNTVDWDGVSEIELDAAEQSFLRKIVRAFQNHPKINIVKSAVEPAKKGTRRR